MVALECERIVAPLADDLLRDVTLAAHGIDGDDRALEREHFQQLGHCGDLVRFAVDGQLAEHQPLLDRPGRDQMQSRAAGGSVKGMAQRLTVDRHHPFGGLREALHEIQEAGVALDRIEQPQHPAEGVVARDAVAQAQELPQKRLLRPAEQRHIGAVLAATQHRAQRDH